METVSIGIRNLMAPCGCACKYCLLRSGWTANGVDYFRGRRLAERFAVWARDKGISPIPYYDVGYCAEYPELLDNIAYKRETGFAGAAFLQCNGIRIRSKEETELFVDSIREAGVRDIDVTFYGSREYHDTFAARQNAFETGQSDYDFMKLLAACAAKKGLGCVPSVVISRENLHMLEDLLDELEGIPGIGRIHSFLPDYRGRGYLLEEARITREDYNGLSDRVKATMNIRRYRTEGDWLSGEMPEYVRRMVVITLRADNIDMLESMSCEEMVAYVERLDDEYYRALPSIHELAEMYGDRDNRRLYQQRDLVWKWQQRYILENHIRIYDVTDERNCCTVRS